MEFVTKDPSGSLHAGTRWTQKFSTSKTVRVIGGLYPSPGTPDDDLIVWTTERDGIANPRPLSGRRSMFHRFEPAHPPRFEKGRTYTLADREDGAHYLVLHVFRDANPAGLVRVVTLRNDDQVIDLYQSERSSYRDVTGKHRGSDCGKADCIVCGTAARKGDVR